MLKEREDPRQQIEFICLDQLVPEDHLLRKIEKHFDFSFIYKKVEHLYCQDNGRPPIDPVVLFKILLLGYLFGVRSERQLMRDIEVNVAYRWFIGYAISEKIPNHSTLSQNRRRRFTGTSVFQEIFNEIVHQAIELGFIDGKTLYTDSTHLKASANKRKIEVKEVTKSTQRYLNELEEDIDEDRKKRGKKPLKKKELKVETKKQKKSLTDPDSGYMMREGKPEGFFYLDHRTVDAKHNLITDAYITPGNMHDSVPYLERLEHQCKTFGFKIQNVGLDSGYNTAHICKTLIDQGIYAVMPYKRPGGKKGMLKKTSFVYDEYYDCYLCPQGQVLDYATTSREGYRSYTSDPEICKNCPKLKQCTANAKHIKTVSRHIWEHYRVAVQDHRYEHKGKRIYKGRSEGVERSFADAKQLHGHRYARYRGIEKVQEQSYLAATAQNIKKMALILWRVGGFTPTKHHITSKLASILAGMSEWQLTLGVLANLRYKSSPRVAA